MQSSHEEKRQSERDQLLGVSAALLSTVFLGWAPIFGKVAFNAGLTPTTVVAVRTALAAGLLWLFYLTAWRRYVLLSRNDLVGCIVVGFVNGIGSLFYYAALARIDASLISLLNTTYALWVVIFLAASGQPLSRYTVVSLILAGMGVALLTRSPEAKTDPLGVMLMLVAAATYGLHLVLGQWVVADASPNSMALYVLTTMAIVVGAARAGQPTPIEAISPLGLTAVIGLGIVTALSRVFLFAGLGRLGGIQTALLGLSELFVTLLVAFAVLGERLSTLQWVGGALLIGAGFLVRRDSKPDLTSDEWMRALEEEAARAARDPSQR